MRSAAAVAQSSARSASEGTCAGVAARAGTARNRRSASRRAAGTASSSSRRVPPRIARAWSSGEAMTRTATESPSSSSAGYPRTGTPADATSTACGSVPTSQVVRPRRSMPGAASATARRARPPSWRRSAPSSRPLATSAPSPSSTRNRTRRWSATLARSKSRGVTGSPDMVARRRARTSSSGPSAGEMPASASRARSGAGTRWRRSALGSERTRAVTRSSRWPGTCQSNPSDRTWLSTASGTCTVTPSSGAPGPNV